MKLIIPVSLVFVLLATPALAQTAQVDRSDSNGAFAHLKRKSGEKPVVAIYDVTSSVAEIQPRAAREMFITALIKSGAFAVAERARLNEGVVRERQLMSGGQATGDADKTRIAGAQYVFEVVISEANGAEDSHDNSVSLGGASLGHQGSSDVIGMDIRITDVSTGLVIDSINVRNRVQSTKSSVSGLGSLANSLLAMRGGSLPLSPDVNLSSGHSGSLDKALRSCVEVGVAELVRRFQAD